MEQHDLEYFKFIRQEILDRIGLHYKVLVTKLVTTGGIFSFLLVNAGKISVSPFLVAALWSFLFDVLLLENLGWIRSAGDFVKCEVEDQDFKIQWERNFAQHRNQWQCFHPYVYLAGVWSIGLFLWIGFVIQDICGFDSGVRVANLFLALISAILGMGTFLLTFMQLKYPTISSFLSWRCRWRLRKVRKYCMKYAAEYSRKFPDNLDEFPCDSKHFKVLSGRTENDTPDTVLAFCDHKANGGNILFVDGSITWCSMRAFHRLVECTHLNRTSVDALGTSLSDP